MAETMNDFVQEEIRMGQKSDSSSSAPQIVDEEALALTGKSKGKAKRKKDGKKQSHPIVSSNQGASP